MSFAPAVRSREGAARFVPALGPAVTFVAALAVYVRTLMPGVAFWDTAEYQTVGPVLGIAHPTGFPSYTLLSWLASVVLQPFGSPAYRLNLFSAILVAGAAALLADAVGRLTGRQLPGVAAGLAFAVCQIAWWTAERAESHALHIFLATALLVLLLAWAQRVHDGQPNAARPLLWACVVYALALGNHGLTLLLAPGVALMLVAVDPGLLGERRHLAVRCAITIAVVTLALYAYIPIRASMNPPLDYAHPTSPDRFAYLVFAAQFHGLLGNPFADGLGPIVTIFSDQLTPPVLWLALAGLAALAIGRGGSRRLGVPALAMTVPWFLITTLFARGYADGFVDRYYLGPLLVVCIWAGVGVAWAWDIVRTAAAGLIAAVGPASLRQRAALPVRLVLVAAAAAILVALPVAHLRDTYDANDASHDTTAAAWGDAALGAMAQNAVVISWWSYSTTLWYERYVAGRRPDILIVDDRDRLDDGYGDLPATIDRFRATGRPVYVIRPTNEIDDLKRTYRLAQIETVPGYSPIWEVVQ